jgi:hypothetical protein
MRLRLVIVFAVAFVTSLAILPATAHSVEYVWIGRNDPQVYVNYSSTPLSRSGASSAATSAAAVWSNQPGRINPVIAGGTSGTGLGCPTSAGLIRISVDATLANGVAGVTNQCTFAGTNQKDRGAIVVNDAQPSASPSCPSVAWAVNTTPTTCQTDLQYVLTHELGHVWGAPHVSDSLHTMQASSIWALGSSAGRSLETHDKDGFNAAYP